MLTLELDQDPMTLVPGQTISGNFGWDEKEPPKSAALRLFWFTVGRGTEDIGIVAEKVVNVVGASHSQEFTMTIPNQPYSFTGKLITLNWSLELVLNGGDPFKRIDLMVSPWTEQVKLDSIK